MGGEERREWGGDEGERTRMHDVEGRKGQGTRIHDADTVYEPGGKPDSSPELTTLAA